MLQSCTVIKVTASGLSERIMRHITKEKRDNFSLVVFTRHWTICHLFLQKDISEALSVCSPWCLLSRCFVAHFAYWQHSEQVIFILFMWCRCSQRLLTAQWITTILILQYTFLTPCQEVTLLIYMKHRNECYFINGTIYFVCILFRFTGTPAPTSWVKPWRGCTEAASATAPPSRTASTTTCSWRALSEWQKLWVQIHLYYYSWSIWTVTQFPLFSVCTPPRYNENSISVQILVDQAVVV